MPLNRVKTRAIKTTTPPTQGVFIKPLLSTIKPPPQAPIAMPTLNAALQQIASAETEVQTDGNMPQGKLRIDAASPFIFHQITPHINAFNKIYPNVELELNSNEGIVDLIEKRTDVAIRIGKLEDSRLHAKVLGKSTLFVVAYPEYIAKKGNLIKL